MMSTRCSGHEMRGVKLDWRFEALGKYSEIQLLGLQEFHAQLKENSKRAMVDWGRAWERLTDEDSRAADELVEERDRIESAMDTWQPLGILGLWAFLENYMDLVIEHLRAGGAKFSCPDKAKRESKLAFLEPCVDLVIEHLRTVRAKFSCRDKAERGSKLEKLRKKFFQAGIDLKKPRLTGSRSTKCGNSETASCTKAAGSTMRGPRGSKGWG